MREHVIGRLVHRSPPGRDLLVCFAFTGQPLRGEEPGLIGRDGNVAAYCDRPVVMDGKLHLIAFTDVQRTPDLLGQCQLRFGPYLHPGADEGLRFDLGGRHAHDSRLFRSDFPTFPLYQISRPSPACLQFSWP
jgi:hypothetical protein